MAKGRSGGPKRRDPEVVPVNNQYPTGSKMKKGAKLECLGCKGKNPDCKGCEGKGYIII